MLKEILEETADSEYQKASKEASTLLKKIGLKIKEDNKTQKNHSEDWGYTSFMKGLVIELKDISESLA